MAVVSADNSRHSTLPAAGALTAQVICSSFSIKEGSAIIPDWLVKGFLRPFCAKRSLGAAGASAV